MTATAKKTNTPTAGAGADPTEPSDQADVDEMRSRKGETKLPLTLFQGLKRRAEQGRQRTSGIGCPEQ
jgi:hypothetical protein